MAIRRVGKMAWDHRYSWRARSVKHNRFDEFEHRRGTFIRLLKHQQMCGFRQEVIVHGNDIAEIKGRQK